MLPTQSVLIVDESIETRTVLRTALEQQGRQIYEATGTDEALQLAHLHHPSVIVFDLENKRAPAPTLADEFRSAALLPSSLLLLGTARRVAQDFPKGEFVAKPYHYAPLIRKIEELLAKARQPAAASV